MAEGLFDHIRLRGSRAFIALTQAALRSLSTAECSAEVWSLLAMVQKGRRSGVDASETVPVISIGKKVWNSPTIWYASGIGHEGFHIKLYRDAKMKGRGHEPDSATWVGADAERKCLEFQLRVLEQLNAESYMLDYVREHMKEPTYQGDPFSRKDYLKRGW